MAYDVNTPLANEIPAQSRPNIQGNFLQIATSYNADHVALTSGINVGQHKQVVLASAVSPAGQTNPQSIIYSSPGTASSIVQAFYKNQNSAFMLIPIKAWGYANNAGIIASQSYNVTSVTNGGTGLYNVVMPANVVASTNYAIIATSTIKLSGTPCVVCNYNISSATQFQITTIAPNQTSSGQLVDVTSLSFIVLQI